MKKYTRVFGSIFTAIFVFVFAINVFIIQNTKALILPQNELTPMHTGIVLGAGVHVNGELSDVLKDRADTAIGLFHARKIQKILVSGDNGTLEHNEVVPTKKYLVTAGIPENVIFLDHAGFDTYDSMYRAKHIFQVKSAVVITQEFHLTRSVYLCQKMGIQCVGTPADKHHYLDIIRLTIRECLSRVKAVWEVLIDAKPRFLGEIIDINK
jgi:SanA protein